MRQKHRVTIFVVGVVDVIIAPWSLERPIIFETDEGSWKYDK